MTLPPALPLSPHRSRSPSLVRAALLAALRQGRLPGDFLYASPSQAGRWLEYHQAFSPSRADPSVEDLYALAFREAAERLKPRVERLKPRVERLKPRVERLKPRVERPKPRAERLEPHAARAESSPPAGGVASGAVAASPTVAGGLAVVGLGAGGGRKDAALLALLASSRPAIPPVYIPIDASPSLAAEAAWHAHGRVPDAEIRPLVADLSALPVEVTEELGSPGMEGSGVEGLGPTELSAWLEAHLSGHGKRVFTCLGMLPNMDHRTFPGWLAQLPRPGDWVLISANLSPAGMEADLGIILPQYDNPPARRWYEGALAELGFAPEDFSLSVGGQALENPPGGGIAGGADGAGEAWRVRVVADLLRPVALSVDGETVPFAQGDRLEVFHSNRFTAAAARNLLEGAGLRIRAEWIHAAGEEGLFLCGG